MKKLMMLAAAVTIVGGAYAQSCSDCNDCGCSLVYDFKATLKTGAARALKDACSPQCLRTCTKINLVGYFFDCTNCTCEAFKEMTFTAVNKKSRTYYFDGVTPEWTLLNQMGRRNTEIEALWTASGDLFGGTDCSSEDLERSIELTFAGCGKVKRSSNCGVDGIITGISGMVVGSGTGPSCPGSCSSCGDTEEPSFSMVYPLCDTEPAEEIDTVYYGTWAMRYNAKKSKKGCSPCGDGEAPYPY